MTYGFDLKFGISRVWDYAAVWEFDAWEFTDVAVADRTGWTDEGGLGLTNFALAWLLKSDCAEFTTVLWVEDEVVVDDEVSAKEDVEDAEEVDDKIEPWPWAKPETEFVRVEVDGFPLLDWY